MKAVVMNGIGGRDMREYVERPEPGAGPGEALVEVAFASVNFMDIVIRQGMSWTEVPDPKILGVEGIRPSPPGSYAQRIAIPATSLVRVPDTIDDPLRIRDHHHRRGRGRRSSGRLDAGRVQHRPRCRLPHRRRPHPTGGTWPRHRHHRMVVVRPAAGRLGPRHRRRPDDEFERGHCNTGCARQRRHRDRPRRAAVI